MPNFINSQPNRFCDIASTLLVCLLAIGYPIAGVAKDADRANLNAVPEYEQVIASERKAQTELLNLFTRTFVSHQGSIDWSGEVANIEHADCGSDGKFAKLLNVCKNSELTGGPGPALWFAAVKQCAAFGITISPNCAEGSSELFGLAVMTGDVEMLKWLIARGMKFVPELAWNILTSCGQTFAWGSPRPRPVVNCEQVLDRLMAFGLKINTVDAQGRTPLSRMSAAGVSNVLMTELLLARGADPNLGGECQSPLDLSYVAKGQASPTTVILKRHGARPRNLFSKFACSVREAATVFFVGAH